MRWIVFFLSVFVTAHACAQTLAPGLALRIEPLSGGGEPDTREVRMAALYVPAGSAPSAFVAPGRFRATWEGQLNLKIRERYSFAAEGRGGKLTVLVDDKPVLDVAGEDLSAKPGEEVRLKKGASKLVIVYESPKTGDASVRLLWSRPGVPRQPPGPEVYTHDATAAATVRGRTLREGRQLIADHRCTKCHSVQGASDAFAELAMDSPSFADIGVRLKRDWMAAWITDPQAIRPDAHMPRMFHAGNRPPGVAPENDTRAADVAAYLATLGSSKSADAEKPATPADVEAGQKLYTALACVACHVPPGATDFAKDPPRVSHEHVAAKFTAAGLKQYLLNPSEHYAWNPMPDFKLSKDEAGQLAAYLLASGTKPLPAAAPNGSVGDPKRGAELVVSAGCLDCHGGIDGKEGRKGRALAEMRVPDAWSLGCVAPDASTLGAAPIFTLDSAQRGAIAAFAATDRSALLRDEPGEFASRQYVAMRCGSCHARDGVESALVATLAREHDAVYPKFFGAPTPGAGAGDGHGTPLAPDQKQFPPLTWTGEKLRGEWSGAFVAGDVTYKPRPYLRARMPAFKVRAGKLASGFAAQHGLAAMSPPNPAPDPSLVPIGHKLVGTVGGFSCVQCHAVASTPALSAFEAPALDFMHVSERLRKDFYHRWMFNPIALDRTTKMPRFTDDEGKTALREILDGDAHKQHEAIWQYLLQGKQVTPAQ